MGAPLEVALLGHQSMVIAPLFDPCCEVSQSMKAEACGPPELLLYHGMKSNGHLSLMPSTSSLCGRKYSKKRSLVLTHSASL